MKILNQIVLSALAVFALAVQAWAAPAANSEDMSRMEKQIRHELVTLPDYGIFDNLEFRVDGSRVTLMGQVNRPTLKSAAERVTKAIEGVSDVVNEIEVLPVSNHDDQIRRAAYRAIYSHSALQRYQLRAVPPIHIIVKNGKITLEGVVSSEMDKNIVRVQANSIPGVFVVTNNLRIDNQNS